MPVRVLLVDDHELVRQGIAAMLSKADDVQVVGEARTGREAIEAARKELPDVVLMDVRMPDMDGLEATRRIKEERPRTAVVMVTMHDNPAYLKEAVRAGAAGYLLKDVAKDELIDAIRQVSSGGAFIESQMLKGMLSDAVAWLVVVARGASADDHSTTPRAQLIRAREGLALAIPPAAPGGSRARYVGSRATGPSR